MNSISFAELLANKRGGPGINPLSNGTEFGSQCHVADTLRLLKSVKALPDEYDYALAKSMLTRISGLEFTDDQTKMLLDLNPTVRIHLANLSNIPHREYRILIQGGLQSAVAHFFLMCSWPGAWEGERFYAFRALLIKQGVALGFDKAH
ncbi:MULTISPECIES: hypothetical protein [Pseudomonas]|uniref:hypothetical protein n=1 Tax=Pseudomonas TaxID=286 RepID=UPI000F02CC66|nr:MULTISPECIES: hypothetical protein [Pseudomonas]MBD8615596.1 hypothetical protein [Pseudomonas putida]MBD8681752.1 hypothetical protein [Pseudomonas sp. CFBP 13719]